MGCPHRFPAGAHREQNLKLRVGKHERSVKGCEIRPYRDTPTEEDVS